MANRLITYYYTTIDNNGVTYTGTHRMIVEGQPRKLRDADDIEQMETECAFHCTERLGTMNSIAVITGWQEMDK